MLVSPGAQPGLLSNTATLQAPSDGNPDNNSSTDAGAVSEPSIDLHIEKVVTSTPDITPAGYATGETVTYRIQVSNSGVADAANVQLIETLDAALTIQSITPSQGTCSGTVCNLGTITSTQAPVTIDVEAVLPPDLISGAYPSNELLNNTATVSAPIGTELNPDDNSASADGLHAAVRRHLAHEILRARTAGRRRPGDLHGDRPQRWARNRRRVRR